MDGNSKVSELIDVGSFLSKWKEVLDEDDLGLEEKELDHSKVAKALKQSEEVVAELEEGCHEETLVCPAAVKIEDMEDFDFSSGPPEGGEQLEILKIRYEAHSQNAQNKFLRLPRYSRTSNGKDLFYDEGEVSETECLRKEPKVLLHVSVYRNYFDYKVEGHWDVHKERELLVLAENKLTEFKDSIICPSDMALVSSDISENPDVELKERGKDVFPSNYFYIEDVFYPDLRHPLSRDISIPVQEWMKSKRPGVQSTCKVQVMEGVTFNDLKIRLGTRYLYVHQGNCEHHIIFNDIRLMTGNDCKDLSMYPLLKNQVGRKRLLCMVCRILCSKWMTRNDSFSPMDPTFFCDSCFRMLHYDKDGNKLGSFEAYPYVDAAVFS